ncbi:BTB-POZ and MATH domain 4 [Striga asiatica]|uniref:BTB-POZ and MATH domain 4 n=1 Tax=Striga asiatica TaxID=4170 RepID=A0A5A7RG48_STRAF|nr:BTB-POZ and MATH domain 4 [Striga asiatica]
MGSVAGSGSNRSGGRRPWNSGRYRLRVEKEFWAGPCFLNSPPSTAVPIPKFHSPSSSSSSSSSSFGLSSPSSDGSESSEFRSDDQFQSATQVLCSLLHIGVERVEGNSTS